MSFLQAIILGVVEGFTEFLPISSTAHLILTSELLGVAQTEYTKSFDIIIQSGAILAVVALYWRRFLEWEMLKRLAAAFIPTGLLGLVLYEFVKRYLLESFAVILWSLALGGALLILLELFHFGRRGGDVGTEGAEREGRLEGISYPQCVALGLFQAIAMVPGVSRSGATIVGGMLLRIPRRVIVEFSFLLAVPTMIAATGLDLFRSAGAFTADQFTVLGVGFVVSFITAIISIRWLLRFVKGHSFTAFGVYRILLVLLFLLLWL